MLEHTGINCWLWSRIGIWAVPREPCNLWGGSFLPQWILFNMTDGGMHSRENFVKVF